MKNRITALCFAVLFAVLLSIPVYANAEAGPDFTVLITGAPEDLTVSLVTPDGVSVDLRPLRRGWESCFRLYYHELFEAMNGDARYSYESIAEMEKTAAKSSLHLVSAEDGIDCTVPMPAENQMRYNHLSVMKIADKTAVPGSSAYMVWRNVLLAALRVSVTLIAEGVIFFLMTYRTRRSWIVFAAVNLVTQIFLNVTITGNYLAMGYWEIGFFFLEGLIFLTEAVLFAALLKEHPKLRGFVTAILANAVSLVCGWALLANLPL
ncbi:MAG: hypothetical protein IJF78_05125 [Clostridia bacterium]|nr:hypothetical protein [Clostridia bacterium]